MKNNEKDKHFPQVVGVAYFVSPLYDGLVAYLEKQTYPALANHKSFHGKRIFFKIYEALARCTY